jgi:hypothetical protein
LIEDDLNRGAVSVSLVAELTVMVFFLK